MYQLVFVFSKKKCQLTRDEYNKEFSKPRKCSYQLPSEKKSMKKKLYKQWSNAPNLWGGWSSGSGFVVNMT